LTRFGQRNESRDIMVHEIDLAWSLANTAAVYLDTGGRHDLYINLGVGETFAVISLLIAVIAREKARPPDSTAPRVGGSRSGRASVRSRL
jgi:hypothetical protein